jgi:hypothetical protein
MYINELLASLFPHKEASVTFLYPETVMSE